MQCACFGGRHSPPARAIFALGDERGSSTAALLRWRWQRGELLAKKDGIGDIENGAAVLAVAAKCDSAQVHALACGLHPLATDAQADAPPGLHDTARHELEARHDVSSDVARGEGQRAPHGDDH